MIAKNNHKVNMKRRKQNHKISFHFLSGFSYRNCTPFGSFVSLRSQKSSKGLAKLQAFASHPTPPAENGLVRKFLVLYTRPQGACEARIVRFTTRSERTIWVQATTRSARAPARPLAGQSSKSCGFCSYNVRTSSKKHRLWSP